MQGFWCLSETLIERLEICLLFGALVNADVAGDIADNAGDLLGAVAGSFPSHIKNQYAKNT